MGIVKRVREIREQKAALEAIRARGSLGEGVADAIEKYPLDSVKLVLLAFEANEKTGYRTNKLFGAFENRMYDAFIERAFNRENVPSVMRTLLRYSAKGFDAHDLVDIAVVGACSDALDPKNLPKTIYHLEKALSQLKNAGFPPETHRRIIRYKIEEGVLNDGNIAPALTEFIEHSKAGVDPLPILFFTAQNPEKAGALRKMRPQLIKTISMIRGPDLDEYLANNPKRLEEQYKTVLPVVAQVLKTYEKRPKGAESEANYWEWIRFSAKQLRSIKSNIK